MKINKAIVTGGAGFIGSHICERLIKENVKVISLDNYLSGDLENYKDFINHPLFTYYDCDISNKNEIYSLIEAFEDVDVIYNEAAAKKVASLNNPEIDKAVNIDGTWNMLNIALKVGCKKFIHASTGSIYGETNGEKITENHSLDPVSYYGVSKLAGEKYVNLFNKLYGIETTIFRYSSVYGTRQRTDGKGGGVISIYIERAKRGDDLLIYGDGKQTRSFTYVGDVVEANMLATESEFAIGKCYNLAGDVNYSIQQIAEMVQCISHNKINIVHTDALVDDVKYYDVDNSLIKKSLCVNFRNDMQEIVRSLYNDC